MKKLVSLCLALAMLATIFAVPAFAAEDKPYAGVKLTYWVKLHENLDAAKVTNMAQTRWYEAVKEATGIEIEFIHPAAGQDGTEFNLLTAVPDEMPDIVEYSWTAYPGGASAAIDDEVIISLNDVIASGKAPHLKAILDNEVAIDKAVKTADGDYYVFPFLRGTTFEDNNCLFTSGFYMRGDILKELGLEVPETIDEWDAVLHAVKAAHPDMIPFITRTEWMNQIFTPGYDRVKLWGSLILFALYIFLLPKIHFIAAGIIFVTLFNILYTNCINLEKLFGQKNSTGYAMPMVNVKDLLISVAIAVIFSVGLWLLFFKVFNITLP